MLVRGPSSLPIHTPPPPRALRRVQTQTDPRYTLSASGLPLALRQTVGPTRFSQIQGPHAPIPFEKCRLDLGPFDPAGGKSRGRRCGQQQARPDKARESARYPDRCAARFSPRSVMKPQACATSSAAPGSLRAHSTIITGPRKRSRTRWPRMPPNACGLFCGRNAKGLPILPAI